LPVRLSWNLDDRPPGRDRSDPEPPVTVRARPRSKVVAFSLAYGIALLAAAWIGYVIGRTTQGQEANLADIETQLAVEQVAWREGDADLYRTTLDPDAPGQWRQQKLDAFRSAAPRAVRISVGSVMRVAPNEASATIVQVDRGVRTVENRAYRLAGSTWYEAPVGPVPPTMVPP